MRYEACDASPDFYCVRGFTKTVREYIQYSIKDTHRYFEDGRWYVHRSEVVDLTQLGYSEHGYVRYGELDTALQMEIAQAKLTWTIPDKKTQKKPVSKPTRATALAVLHLQPDAPDYVIKAVWRAVASKHHPDNGGDAEVFKKYSEAYERLK